MNFGLGLTPNISSGDFWMNEDGLETLRLGCWDGTLYDFREMIAGDNWPSHGDEAYRNRYRGKLLAVADLCQAELDAWREEA
jgi:hypothetical protein